MSSFLAFIKKEALEQLRSGRLTILGILFVLFGIMNPAVAKLTPLLLEAMADSLAESGMIVTQVNVTAMDSWVQFFKNVPMALIAFVLLQSGIFTREYSEGTLVILLTKGLSRVKTVFAKVFVLTSLWTVLYLMCAIITYGYNAYFWDNSVAQSLLFSIVCWWLFGVWVISIFTLFSTVLHSSAGVLCGTCGVVFVCFIIGLLPECSKLLPTHLTDGSSLIYGTAEPASYFTALAVTAVLSIACFVLSIPIFNKKKL